MIDLHKENGEVVNKQKCVNHTICVLNNIVVLNPSASFVKYSNSVEQPEGEHENKQKGTNTSSEQVYPRHRGLSRTEK